MKGENIGGFSPAWRLFFSSCLSLYIYKISIKEYTHEYRQPTQAYYFVACVVEITLIRNSPREQIKSVIFFFFFFNSFLYKFNFNSNLSREIKINKQSPKKERKVNEIHQILYIFLEFSQRTICLLFCLCLKFNLISSLDGWILQSINDYIIYTYMLLYKSLKIIGPREYPKEIPSKQIQLVSQDCPFDSYTSHIL